MKWFLSYVQVYATGEFQFGHFVSAKTPLEAVDMWNSTLGKRDRFKCILLSFHQVPDETPDSELLSSVICEQPSGWDD